MKILYADSTFWTSETDNFKQELKQVVTKAHKKVKPLLPFLSEEITIVVQPNKYEVIPETGENGFTRNFGLILLFFDPDRLNQKEALLNNIYGLVLHELNHAARYAVTDYEPGFLANCVVEGVAVVFEREYGDRGEPLWARYEPEKAKAWLKELRQLDGHPNYEHYMFEHPDGRRWIGYKVGTYIVDQASKNSGKTVLELTQLNGSEIIKLAKV